MTPRPVGASVEGSRSRLANSEQGEGVTGIGKLSPQTSKHRKHTAGGDRRQQVSW